MAGYFELFKNSQGAFRFNLKAGNHEVILTSESYTSKSGAQTGIESVKANASIDARYDRRTAKDGSPYFVLKAANGEVTGTSEMYSSTAARDAGIASVKANAPHASSKDLTGS